MTVIIQSGQKNIIICSINSSRRREDSSLRNEHLSDGWKFELLTKKREILKEVGRENLKIPTGNKNSMTLSLSDNVIHNTRNIIADELGWSTGKVAMADRGLSLNDKGILLSSISGLQKVLNRLYVKTICLTIIIRKCPS